MVRVHVEFFARNSVSDTIGISLHTDSTLDLAGRSLGVLLAHVSKLEAMDPN